MIETLDSDFAPRMGTGGMLVTDMDGTLLGSDRTLARVNRTALERLGERGYVRVVATGRNPHSFLKAGGGDFPIDYAILSSGAAVRVQSTGRYVRTISLDPEEVWDPARMLLDMDIDFMILDPLPDNHLFAHCPATRPCSDYWRRIELYAEYARPLLPQGSSRSQALRSDMQSFWPGPASQLLAMEPEISGRDAHAHLRPLLTRYTVLRSSSPLGSGTTWVEVFPSLVSKSQATAWLALHLGLGPEDVLCVGNDYNDEDLLAWGGTSYVVANAPQGLKDRFPTVGSNDAGGVAEAAAKWHPDLGAKKSPRAKGGENPGGQSGQ